MLLSKSIACNSKKLKFIKGQEASGLLRSLINIPLNKIPLLGPFCFKGIQEVNTRYKINEIVNKLLLVGDKSMPEMQLGFTYSSCGPFSKNKERIR